MTTETKLEPCPWCRRPLYQRWYRANPHAECRTEGCFGARCPVVNLDDSIMVAAWNTRAAPAVESARQQALEEAAKVADARREQWLQRWRASGDIEPKIPYGAKARECADIAAAIRALASQPETEGT